MRLGKYVYYYRQMSGPPVFGLCGGNSFAIKGPDGMALVDPGTSAGPHLWLVEWEMKRDGLRFGDIDRIIVTHAHPDHAGAAEPLSRRLRAPVIAHHLEIPTMKNQQSFFDAELKAAAPALSMIAPPPKLLVDMIFLVAMGPQEPCKNLKAVREGDDLGLGAPATVIEIPGHRPGEIGIFIPDDGIFISGDLINRRRYDLPSLNLPLADLDQTEASLKKIRSLSPEVFTPAHEPPVRGRDRVRKWLDAALKRCGDIRRETEREIKKGGEISLWRLGRKLRAGNSGASIIEEPFLAFVALKSVGYFGELTKKDIDSNAKSLFRR